jgi:hypothetical protein
VGSVSGRFRTGVKPVAFNPAGGGFGIAGGTMINAPTARAMKRTANGEFVVGQDGKAMGTNGAGQITVRRVDKSATSSARRWYSARSLPRVAWSSSETGATLTTAVSSSTGRTTSRPRVVRPAGPQRYTRAPLLEHAAAPNALRQPVVRVQTAAHGRPRPRVPRSRGVSLEQGPV